MNRLLLSFALSFICSISFAQRKCGTDQYHDLLHQQSNLIENELDFENWLKNKISKKGSSNIFSTKADGDIYTIPIVVHIIHQGEALGTGSNIPDEQILSQMDIINQDFRRLNANASSTLSEFLPVAADAEIEFVLAKRDPEGLPTTGIVRKQGTLSSYDQAQDDRELKSQSYWPAEDYLNIWVTILDGNFLGYASFPVSNLEGLNVEQSISSLTDGVAMDYRFFGVGFNANGTSGGRTVTHEIGHYLGLRHVFAGGCSSTDYCDDTPEQSNSTPFSAGCDDLESSQSCGSLDMIQNYLDFTADECMSLFTLCQKSRMRAVLENSPRRISLLTSKALEDPIIAANDLGIKEVLSPLSGDCNNTITPQVEVRNYGTNSISEFKIDLYIDESLVESVIKNTAISELSTSIVSFSDVIIEQKGTSVYRFEITETNGVVDGNSENDQETVTINFPESQPIPYSQGFDTPLTDWQTINSSNEVSGWSQGSAPFSSIDDQGMVLSYFNSPTGSFGEIDMLISPVFDLSSLPSADISFRYAYAALPGNITDVLTIAVSTDCGNTFPEENYIFQRFSPSLSTAGTTSESFTPEGSFDWEDIDINITQFVGNENVVIAFLGHNGGGNNLYIDDFLINSENKLDYDLSLRSVDQVPLVSCTNSLFPTLEIKNLGVNTITEFTLIYTLDGNPQTLDITDINVLPGKLYTARPSIQNIENGPHEIVFTISSPNGNTDENPENDTESIRFEISEENDTNPIKERFEDSELNPAWSLVRPDAQHNWSLVNAASTNVQNQAIRIEGSALEELGIENWLVSPSLDLSVANNASIQFKVSYANQSGRNDRLKILLSLNCGRSYTETVYDKKGEDLAITTQSDPWLPNGPDDWKTEFVDISEYAIWREVRAAFVVTNQNGNNLYLDDIEFLVSANPNVVEIEDEQLRIYPNPAKSNMNLKFDLASKTDLTIRVVNLMGKVVYEGSFPNTLNQTYPIDNIRVDNGLYLVNVLGNGISYSRSVLIWN